MYCIAIRPCLVLAVTTTTIAAVDQAAMYSCIILPESSSSLLQFSLINLFSCFRSLSLHMHQPYLMPPSSTPYHFQYTLPACLAFNTTPSRLTYYWRSYSYCCFARAPNYHMHHIHSHTNNSLLFPASLRGHVTILELRPSILMTPVSCLNINYFLFLLVFTQHMRALVSSGLFAVS